ncbi:unnamed protein product [Vitrella brassicaformis CCMP3155]|uniref:Uncharacterized protein n=1 Tax=Vitrella brassicaformis (strain CCMP3155) TaxID=1169540 RepID=A0A0G4FNF8_VITBC|nr:unnamed protein product [Vitrella brassicaformis CCMP3155]|eukprot:CEM15785.1 unnamed protein product [Vitrella brassicaformis CCMP3155]
MMKAAAACLCLLLVLCEGLLPPRAQYGLLTRIRRRKAVGKKAFFPPLTPWIARTLNRACKTQFGYESTYDEYYRYCLTGGFIPLVKFPVVSRDTIDELTDACNVQATKRRLTVDYYFDTQTQTCRPAPTGEETKTADYVKTLPLDVQQDLNTKCRTLFGSPQNQCMHA